MVKAALICATVGSGLFSRSSVAPDHHAVLAEAAKRGLFFDPGLLNGVKHVLGLFRRETLLALPSAREGLRGW